MDYEIISRSTQNFLVRRTVEEFVRAIRLLDSLTDEKYPSIGGHIRHNLDFAKSFLGGLERGKIDYGQRERDERIEQNRAFAIEQIVTLIHRLLKLSDEVLQKQIEICSEFDSSVWHDSSVMRELEFLHSHTVHHHALIAEKLLASGVRILTDFGVAPSTLKFWAEQKQAA